MHLNYISTTTLLQLKLPVWGHLQIYVVTFLMKGQCLRFET